MRTVLLTIFSLLFCSLYAQTEVKIRFQHMVNGNAYEPSSNYMTSTNTAFNFTRAEFYLCDFKLMHDGGQELDLSGNAYLLSDVDEVEHSIGSHNVSSLEGISFSVGVDQGSNHEDPALYAPTHPLAPQNPSMHWGWSAGYRFIALEGNVDSDGNNAPDQVFQYHVVGNQYLTPVSLTTSGMMENGVLYIDLEVNYGILVEGIDMVRDNIVHGSGAPIDVMMGNAANMFSVSGATAVEEIDENSAMVSNSPNPFDGSTVIRYDLPQYRQLDVVVVDMMGRELMRESSVNAVGELNWEADAAGFYFVNFYADDELVARRKMIAQ